MDPKLVEEITRLVISELKAHSAANSRAGKRAEGAYQPLTDSELREWKNISPLLTKTEESSSAIDYTPLTNEEISKWNKLNISIKAAGSRKKINNEVEKVRFSQF